MTLVFLGRIDRGVYLSIMRRVQVMKAATPNRSVFFLPIMSGSSISIFNEMTSWLTPVTNLLGNVISLGENWWLSDVWMTVKVLKMITRNNQLPFLVATRQISIVTVTRQWKFNWYFFVNIIGLTNKAEHGLRTLIKYARCLVLKPKFLRRYNAPINAVGSLLPCLLVRKPLARDYVDFSNVHPCLVFAHLPGFRYCSIELPLP